MESKINQSRAGELDPDFGSTPEAPGFISILHALDWPVGRDLFFSSVAPTPDSSLLVCGYFAETVASPVEYFITRLKDGGQRDTSFGDDGIVRGRFSPDFHLINVTKMTVQSDGKILLQGLGFLTSEDLPDPVLLVARFLSTGVVDQTFGSQGLMRHNLPPDRHSFLAYLVGDLQVVSGGRVLACNTSVSYESYESKDATERALIYRLTDDGKLDATFNGTGLVELGVPLSTPDASLRVTKVLGQAGDKVILVGQLTAVEDRYSRGIIARLDDQGQLDTTFGPIGNGFFEFSLDGYSVEINTVAISPGGSIACAGLASALKDPDLGLRNQGFIIVVTADGNPDSGFNGGQLKMTPIDDVYSVQWVSSVFQADGKLVVTGRSRASVFDSYFYVARYNADGTSDASFGNEGSGRVDIPTGGNTNFPIEMQLQADNKFVIGLNGTSLNKGVLWRLLND